MGPRVVRPFRATVALRTTRGVGRLPVTAALAGLALCTACTRADPGTPTPRSQAADRRDVLDEAPAPPVKPPRALPPTLAELEGLDPAQLEARLEALSAAPGADADEPGPPAGSEAARHLACQRGLDELALHFGAALFEHRGLLDRAAAPSPDWHEMERRWGALAHRASEQRERCQRASADAEVILRSLMLELQIQIAAGRDAGVDRVATLLLAQAPPDAPTLAAARGLLSEARWARLSSGAAAAGAATEGGAGRDPKTATKTAKKTAKKTGSEAR